LAGAAGRLRSAGAPALRLKRVPELRFAYDEGLDAARRVEELLREVDDDRSK
jgi:ribosome-binding factor A